MAGATPITLNQLSPKSSELNNFTFKPPVIESSNTMQEDVKNIQDANNQILTQLTDVTKAFVTGKYKGKQIASVNSTNPSGNGLLSGAIDAFKDFKNNKSTKISSKASNWFNKRQPPIEPNIPESPKTPKQNFISDLLSGDKTKGVATAESAASKGGGILAKSKGALKKIPLLGAALSAVDLGMSVASGDSNAIGGSIGSIIGGGLGSLVGSVVPGAGTAIGGIAGSMAGDWLGSKVGDLFGQSSSNIKIADVNLSGKKVLEQDSDMAKQFSKMGIDGSAPVIVIDKADIKVKQEDGGILSGAWDKIKGFFGFGPSPSYQGTGLGGTGLTGGGGLNAGSINRARGGTGVIPQVGGELGSLSQKYEAAGNIGNVSYDSTGGFSYGRTQFASKGNNDSITGYLAALEKSGVAGGAELAAKMRAAGPASEGGKKAWEDFYKNANPDTIKQHQDFENKYSKQVFYDPNFNKIANSNSELADMINKNSSLQQVLYSTGAAHASRASEIFTQSYNKVKGQKGSVSADDLIDAVYDNRLYGEDLNDENKKAGRVVRYASSTDNIKQAMVQRYGTNERRDAHALAAQDKLKANVNTQNNNQQLLTLAKDSGVKLNRDGTIDVSTVPGYDTMQFAGKADISKMDPETATRMAAMSKQIYETTGIKPNFTEGYRDYNEQINTYRKYGPGRAATPGGSDHGTGTAFDFSESQVPQLEAALRAKGTSMEELGNKFGLKRTVNGESWHFAATDRQTQQMQQDKQNKQTGKRIGSDYLAEDEKRALSKDNENSNTAVAQNTPKTSNPTNISTTNPNTTIAQVIPANLDKIKPVKDSSSNNTAASSPEVAPVIYAQDTQLAQEQPVVPSQTATAAASAASAAVEHQALNTPTPTATPTTPSSGDYQSTAQASTNNSTPVFYIDDPHVQTYRIDPLRPVA